MTKKIENSIIGIDVSKEKLDIWLLPNNRHYIINNNIRTIGRFFTSLKKQTLETMETDASNAGNRSNLSEIKIQVLLEPTGGYEKLLIKKLLEYGIEVRMVHPNRLYHFAKGQGFEAKTDKLASKELALYLKQNQLIGTRKIDDNYKKTKALQELSNRRRQVKETLKAEKNRLSHEFFNKEISKSCKRCIKYLEKEVERLDQLINQEIEKQEELKNKKELLESFKGVGRITAQSLVLDVPELGKLSREAIAKLIGVAPLNNESGNNYGTRHIRGGRAHVRKILYMAALVAIRFNERIKRIYDRLISRGKLFKVAIVAVMRKMLCMLNIMLKRNIPWQQFSGLSLQNP